MGRCPIPRKGARPFHPLLIKGEDGFDAQVEDFCDGKSQRQARVVALILDRVDGLTRDALRQTQITHPSTKRRAISDKLRAPP